MRHDESRIDARPPRNVYRAARRIACVLGALVALSGCSKSEAPMSEMAQMSSPTAADHAAVPTLTPADNGSRFEASAAERIVLRAATVNAVVHHPRKSASRFARMAQDMGGFVVSSTGWRSEGEREYGDYGDYDDDRDVAETASLVIRVPEARLDDVLDRIEEHAVDVTQRTVTGEDVTQQYTDARSSLRNLEAAETQLLRVMDAATKTEGVLAVLERLTTVRSQIEVLRGRLQFFDESSRFARVQIDFAKEPPPREVSAWGLGSTAGGAFHALVSVLQFLLRAVIALVIVVLPLGFLSFLFIWLPVRAIRRRRLGRASEGA